MEKERVKKGEKYWYIDIDLSVQWYFDNNDTVDNNMFCADNYFATEEEAESMARKLRAVLKGADVIEIPSENDAEKESKHKAILGGYNWECSEKEAYLDGFADCLHWLKSKVK